MTIGGQPGGAEIFKAVIGQVLQLIKRKRQHSTATCDGVVLKMHYMYTFWMCLGIFSAVWYSWYHKDSIVCASQYNAESNSRADHINLCLSYNSFKDPVDGNVKNIMFYKWLPISILLLGFVYYLPRKVSKMFENQRTARLLELTAANESEFKEISEDKLISAIVSHFEESQKLNNVLFYKYFLCNIIALVLNICSIFTLNFFMQGRFLTYGVINILSLYRDPVRFTDAISRTFPPFTICELTPTMQLTSDRTEVYGCHLTHMELYEKIFFFLWWWLMFLLVASIVYIVFLSILIAFPSFRVFLLRFSKTDQARKEDLKVRVLLRRLLQKCSIGDVYLLYRLKQHTSSRMLWKIVSSMEPKMVGLEEYKENSESLIHSV